MAIYAIDFDGTLAETRFPEIIGPKEKMVKFVKAIQATGHKTILWTSRVGEDLDNAVEWCREQGIIFDAVNEPLPEQTARWGNDTRKIYADYYIDDKAMTVKEAERLMDRRMDCKKGGIRHMKGEEIIDFLKTVIKQTKEDILTWEITEKETLTWEITGRETIIEDTHRYTYQAKMNRGRIELKEKKKFLRGDPSANLHIAANSGEYYSIFDLVECCEEQEKAGELMSEIQMYIAAINSLINEKKVKYAFECLLGAESRRGNDE